MVKLLAVLCVILCFLACSHNAEPTGEIEENPPATVQQETEKSEKEIPIAWNQENRFVK